MFVSVHTILCISATLLALYYDIVRIKSVLDCTVAFSPLAKVQGVFYHHTSNHYSLYHTNTLPVLSIQRKQERLDSIEFGSARASKGFTRKVTTVVVRKVI